MESLSNFLFEPVYGNGDRKVGVVDDVIVDESTGYVAYLSIQPTNEKRHMRIRLTWSELKTDEKGDLTINMPPNATKALLLS